MARRGYPELGVGSVGISVSPMSPSVAAFAAILSGEAVAPSGSSNPSPVDEGKDPFEGLRQRLFRLRNGAEG